MKKIGLVTLYNSDNYGALLQAYALQKVINNNNCECEIIQHNRFGFDLENEHKTKKDKLNDNFKYVHLSLKNPKVLKYFFGRFNNSIKRDLKINKSKTLEFRQTYFRNTTPIFYNSVEQIQNDPPICDAYLCGSDQIWNPSRFKGAAPFFLDFGEADVNRISYAPSLSTTCIPDAMREQYKTWLSRFDFVSVREKTGCDAVEEATGIRPEWVLDPTFLLSKEEWDEIAIVDNNLKKKYICCYFLGKENFICALSSIKKIAKYFDAEIVVLPKGRHILAKDIIQEEQLCGPSEFLGYIKNAEFVLTDSFHGTALSLIYGKQFCSFRGRKNSTFVYKFNRIENILNIVGLESRTFCEGEAPNLEYIDYNKVYEKLEPHITNSKAFLSKALDFVQKKEYMRSFPNLVSHDSCTGCTACAAVCPADAIKMEQDKNGFWHPCVNFEKCLKCGKCENVCPARKKYEYKNDYQTSDYAFYCINKELRKQGSSGNAFGALATIINEKYSGIVYGAAFDDDKYSVSCKSTQEVTLTELQKSKYLESYLNDAILKIRAELNNGKYVLFCGTPCQVAGVRSVLGYHEKLFLIDFICHGVPSAGWYKKYIQELETKYKSKVVFVDFRSKAVGWTPHCIKIKFENGKTYLKTSLADPYMQDFSKNRHLRTSCYNCNRILHSVADITIGDYWALRKKKNIANTNEGVSIVTIRTINGEQLMEVLKKDEKNFCMSLKENDLDETYVFRYRKVPKNHDIFPDSFPMRPKLTFRAKVRKMYYEVYVKRIKYHNW